MAGAEIPTGDEKTWLGAFGEQWFKTLCMIAACPAAKVDPDQVDTDWDVHDHDYEIIRVQVKTTENPTIVAGQYVYDLDVEAYDRLRRGSTWGYLLLVVVHSEHPGWATCYRSGTVVRATAYWTRLAGMLETDNQATVRISLPQGNLLTPDVLLDLFPKGGEDDGGTS